MANDNQLRVTTRTINYGDEVKKIWGEEWNKRDYVYHFSNDRKFYEPLEQDVFYLGAE